MLFILIALIIILISFFKSEFLGVGSVDGVVEADEVFFAYSYKGTKPANMPRPSRKGGKQVKKRGISKEQVCVGTALDRQGNIIRKLSELKT